MCRRHRFATPAPLPVLSFCLGLALVTPGAGSDGPAEGAANREQTATASRDEAGVDAESRGGAGMRVFIDPETGSFTSRPTAAQLESIGVTPDDGDPALRRSVEGLRPFLLRAGGQGLFLAGRFQTAVTVRVQEDGSYETLCATETHSPDEPPPAAAPPAAPARRAHTSAPEK